MSTLTAVASFDGDGVNPAGGALATDADGDLFGATGSGGASFGTVVEIAKTACRRRLRRNTAWPVWSTACSVKTALDVSMAMRVISGMDGPQLSLDNQPWHTMPRGRPPQRKSAAHSGGSGPHVTG